MSAPALPCELCGQSPTHRRCARCDPEGFQRETVASVREIAATGQLYLYTLISGGRDVFFDPLDVKGRSDAETARLRLEAAKRNDARRKGAHRYLVELGLEPRPAKKARAA